MGVRSLSSQLFGRADRLTSIGTTPGKQLILTSDGTDETLTCNTGNLNLTSSNLGVYVTQHMAVGSSSALQSAFVFRVIETGTVSLTGLVFSISGNPAAGAASYGGINGIASISNGNAQNVNSLIAAQLSYTHAGTGTVSVGKGAVNNVTVTSTGTISAHTGFETSSNQLIASSTITAWKGFRANAAGSTAGSVIVTRTDFEAGNGAMTGTGTTAYGFRCQTFDTGFTTRWAFYADGNDSFFQNVSIANTKNIYPATNGGSSVGQDGAGFSSVILKDTAAAFELTTQFTCTGIAADRTLTINLGDASRTLDLRPSSAYTPSNVTTDRTYDADSTSIDELADVLGTLIADLQTKGILG